MFGVHKYWGAHTTLIRTRTFQRQCWLNHHNQLSTECQINNDQQLQARTPNVELELVSVLGTRVTILGASNVLGLKDLV